MQINFVQISEYSHFFNHVLSFLTCCFPDLPASITHTTVLILPSPHPLSTPCDQSIIASFHTASNWYNLHVHVCLFHLSWRFFSGRRERFFESVELYLSSCRNFFIIFNYCLYPIFYPFLTQLNTNFNHSFISLQLFLICSFFTLFILR